jgi:transcriptional regulator with XRE-family HTH domain
VKRQPTDFGRWLARLRAQSGLSQPALARELSRRLGKPFNHSTLAHWELGATLRNADVLPALASSLGVTLEDLLKVQQTSKGYVPRPDDDLPPKRF